MEIRGGRVTLTREELYAQVWTTTMRKLAPTYGLSDVGLKKVCKKHGIPTPPVGYWVKKEFGKRVRQPPLPAPAEGSSTTISLAHDPDPKPPGSGAASYPVSDPDLLERYLHERVPEHRIEVPEQLRNPHPILQRTREALAGKKGANRSTLLSPGFPDAPECADISVSRDSIPRALRLLDGLFRALEERGHRVVVRPRKPGESSVRNRVTCLMLGEEFGVSLREKTRMVEIPPAERKADPYFTSKIQYEPTGVLELRITGDYWYAVSTWKDGKIRRLEDQLNKVLIALLIVVEKRRRRRKEQQRQAAIWRRQEEERREQERLRQIERARIEQFEALAGRWQRAEILRAFVEAVRDEAIRRTGGIEPGSGLARWLAWADRYIGRMDPLMAAALPGLEELEPKVAG